MLISNEFHFYEWVFIVPDGLHNVYTRRKTATTQEFNKDFKRMISEQDVFGALSLKDIRSASDGTKKILLMLDDGHVIETVGIPCDQCSTTVCVSRQVGYAMNCEFCYTGRNLSTGEIVEQAVYARRLLSHEVGSITNVVFMGMVEPYHNIDNVIKAANIMVDKHGLQFNPHKDDPMAV